jgi:hypothetical protein
MRDVSILKNKFSGKSAVLYASGPSIDNHEKYKKYTRGCIRFGINLTFEKIGNLENLFIHELGLFNTVKKKFSENKIIIPNLTGLNISKSSKREKINSGNFIQYKLQDLTKLKKHDLPSKYYGDDESKGFIAYSTTTQSALHILCYMGFKKIYLIGVDYRLFDNGKVHFKSRICKDYTDQEWNAFRRFKEGDDYIIPALEQSFGCEIINLPQKIDNAAVQDKSNYRNAIIKDLQTKRLSEFSLIQLKSISKTLGLKL